MLKSEFFSLSALGEFPEEAAEALFKDYTALLHSPAALTLLEDRRARFEKGDRFSYHDSCKELQTYAKAVGVTPSLRIFCSISIWPRPCTNNIKRNLCPNSGSKECS